MRYQEIISMNCKKTANPLKYYLYLIFGIILAIFSVIFWFQIIFMIIWQFKPSLFWYQEDVAYFMSTMLY